MVSKANFKAVFKAILFAPESGPRVSLGNPGRASFSNSFHCRAALQQQKQRRSAIPTGYLFERRPPCVVRDLVIIVVVVAVDT